MVRRQHLPSPWLEFPHLDSVVRTRPASEPADKHAFHAHVGLGDKRTALQASRKKHHAKSILARPLGVQKPHAPPLGDEQRPNRRPWSTRTGHRKRSQTPSSEDRSGNGEVQGMGLNHRGIVRKCGAKLKDGGSQDRGLSRGHRLREGRRLHAGPTVPGGLTQPRPCTKPTTCCSAEDRTTDFLLGRDRVNELAGVSRPPRTIGQALVKRWSGVGQA